MALQHFMSQSYFEHPTEDALERYLLRHSPEAELEGVETHMFACESCVERLEALELQISATKLALEEISKQERQPAPERSWQRWFTVPHLSLAGAAAALVLGLAVIPQLVQHTAMPVEVSLTANRGTERQTAPEGRPLRLHLGAEDLADGPVRVIVLDAGGKQLWQGTGSVSKERVDVTVPSIAKAGDHLLRLYSPVSGSEPGQLLREYSFVVK